jgi:hypothetical protein
MLQIPHTMLVWERWALLQAHFQALPEMLSTSSGYAAVLQQLMKAISIVLLQMVRHEYS